MLAPCTMNEVKSRRRARDGRSVVHTSFNLSFPKPCQPLALDGAQDCNRCENDLDTIYGGECQGMYVSRGPQSHMALNEAASKYLLGSRDAARTH